MSIELPGVNQRLRSGNIRKTAYAMGPYFREVPDWESSFLGSIFADLHNRVLITLKKKELIQRAAEFVETIVHGVETQGISQEFALKLLTGYVNTVNLMATNGEETTKEERDAAKKIPKLERQLEKQKEKTEKIAACLEEATAELKQSRRGRSGLRRSAKGSKTGRKVESEVLRGLDLAESPQSSAPGELKDDLEGLLDATAHLSLHKNEASRVQSGRISKNKFRNRRKKLKKQIDSTCNALSNFRL
ncbi:hypothetical protein QR680_016772 [Steinernema hermaphroditum]|uniref:Uncharacterized protein n=1 Tax=Steinernema hermaphroditum TaxID=289476 RepID=A0AA39HC91_9BILA|nr:hypothetical protein QR680_016772 [Steinernema hermaphroditum]